MLNDDMGKGKIAKGGGSLTEDDWKHMSEKWSMSVAEAKKNTLQELQKQVKA